MWQYLACWKSGQFSVILVNLKCSYLIFNIQLHVYFLFDFVISWIQEAFILQQFILQLHKGTDGFRNSQSRQRDVQSLQWTQ